MSDDITVFAEGQLEMLAVRVGRHVHNHPAKSVFLPAAGGVCLITSVKAILLGWSLGNTDAADAGVFTVYNGPTANNAIVGTSLLDSAQSDTVYLGPGGILCDSGITVITSGAATVVGAVYYRTDLD